MKEVRFMTIYLAAVLWIAFFVSLFLFTDFFIKVTQESFGDEDMPDPPDGLKRPLIIAVFSLTFLSIGTYAAFMLGIHRYDTRLMLPWAFVIGFKCIAGGILLIYLSSFVTSWTLLQGMVFYGSTVLSFIGIYYCYLRTVVFKKIIAKRLSQPEVDKISIISVPDEKLKTII